MTIYERNLKVLACGICLRYVEVNSKISKIRVKLTQQQQQQQHQQRKELLDFSLLQIFFLHYVLV